MLPPRHIDFNLPWRNSRRGSCCWRSGVTANGASLPIKWIGRQHFKQLEGLRWDKAILPVRLSRFALDDRNPQGDLYLSPNHALFIDGVLIRLFTS